MKKECETHGLTEFSKGTKPRCRKCAIEAVKKRRNKLKQMAVDYKGGKCQKCGYDRCIAALDFHHIDESQKEFGISGSGYSKSWEKIKKELDKCILVCANCHREIHSQEA